MLKSQKGISFILLMFIVLIIIAIIIIGIKYIKEETSKENIEDIKSHMLSIQGATNNIYKKHLMNEEENPLLGIKVNLENNETEYVISEELKEILKQIENANLYILTQEDIDNSGIKQVTINNTEFYIVDYNSNEVYYSLGVNGKYSLESIGAENEGKGN